MGSFGCACNEGFFGNGFNCTGTYVCCIVFGANNILNKDIPVGHNVFICVFASIVDIDECMQGTHNCSTLADCSNTVGGFSCQCRPGYVGDGVSCSSKLYHTYSTLSLVLCKTQNKLMKFV